MLSQLVCSGETFPACSTYMLFGLIVYLPNMSSKSTIVSKFFRTMLKFNIKFQFMLIYISCQDNNILQVFHMVKVLTGQHAFLSVCKMRCVFSSFLLLKGCLSQTGQTMPTSKWNVSICSEKFVMPLNSSLDSHRMQTQINSSDQPLLPLPGPPSDLWSPAKLRL